MQNRMFWGIIGVLLFLVPTGNAWSERVLVSDERLNLSIMRPDAETRRQWRERYQSAPQAYIDEQVSSMLMGAEQQGVMTSLSLLNYLQYTPTERDAGNCGDCWVWAGTGIMEIALDLQNGIRDRLSTQFFDSCSSPFACCGGDLDDFTSWYSSQRYAIPWSSSNASFQDTWSSCDGSAAVACGAISTTQKYTIGSIAAATISTQGVSQTAAISNIKNILNQNKGIYFDFFLANNTDWNAFFDFWDTQPESAVWDPDPYCGHTWNEDEGGGHAVLIVGYDDSAATPYWLALNSWGTTANRPNGLFRIKMKMNYSCTMHETGYGNWYSEGFRTLNVVYSGTPPDRATLVSPSGTVDTALPTYTWNAVSSATWYYLWVNVNGGNVVKQWYSASDAGCAGGTGICSVTPIVALTAGSATWWVQTWNSNSYGPWSDSMGFTVPEGLPAKATLVSPSGTINTNTPTYTWNAVSNSTSYYLWVEDSTGGDIKQWYTSAQADCASGTGICSVTPDTAVAAGSGKWWIQTWNSIGYGPWSVAMAFTAPVPPPPGKAALVSPSGTIVNNWSAYAWNADAHSTWYLLWVNDSTGNKIKQWYSAAQAGCSGGAGICSVRSDTALASGSAKWWIQTWNSGGYGAWSDSMAFTVPAPVFSGKASLVSPSGTITSTVPIYTWNVDANSTWYYLWVDDSTGNKIKQWYTAAQAGCSGGTGTCLVTPDVTLAAGSAKWWVQTWNPNGFGPWSDGMAFTVNSSGGATQ